MCCRYWADESPEIRAIVEEMNESPLVGKWKKTTAIKTYGEIHNRMPLIMPEQLVSKWIRPDVKPEDLLGSAVTDLIYEKVAG